MIKRFRLEFISKKTLSKSPAWRDFIDAGLLNNSFGVLTGLFLDKSPGLSLVVDAYERDKAKLSIRMESSCQVIYEQSDIDSHNCFKLYPPDVQLVQKGKHLTSLCEECGRSIGCRFGSLNWPPHAVEPDCAVAITNGGDVVFREDLVQQLQVDNEMNEVELGVIWGSNGPTTWSAILSAPIATRIGHRAGYCHSCGGAVKCDGLPEVDETYSGRANQKLILSPDRPGLPCFTRDMAQWVIDASALIEWGHFKPVEFQAA